MVTKQNTLTVVANNETFPPDPWKGHEKTLVIVYKFGENGIPNTDVVREGDTISIP